MTIPITAQPGTGIWENNIKTYFTDIRCKNAVLSQLALDTSCCECGNETSGSLQGGEFTRIDRMSGYQVLNNNCALDIKLLGLRNKNYMNF
jgi:hypothetical protein